MRTCDKKEKILTCLLICVTAMQFIVLCWFNITKVEQLLDFDFALEFRHVIELWNNRTLYILDWNNTTTLEIDSPVFFAVPIYNITSNISFSIGIVHTFLVIMFVLIVLDIYKNMGRFLWESLMAVLLLLTPYTIISSPNNLLYNNMLFTGGGQYEFRVLVVFLFIDILLCGNVKKKIYLSIVLFPLLFWTSFSAGNFTLLMGIFPIVAAILLEKICSEDFRYTKVDIFMVIFGILVCLFAIVIRPTGNAFRNNLLMITGDKLFENIQNCIVGIFLLIDGVSTGGAVPILSLNGVVQIIKIGLVLLCMVLPFIALFKYKLFYNKLLGFGVSIMVVNLVVLMLTNTQYGSFIFEARYHILWFSIILLCLPILIGNILKVCGKKRLTIVCNVLIVFCIMLLNMFGAKKCIDFSNPNYETAKYLLQTAVSVNVDQVILYDEGVIANIMRALNPEILSFNVTGNGDEFAVDLWNFYMDRINGGNLNKNNLLVTKSFEYLPEEIRSVYEPIGEYGGVGIYYTKKNPWVF